MDKMWKQLVLFLLILKGYQCYANATEPYPGSGVNIIIQKFYAVVDQKTLDEFVDPGRAVYYEENESAAELEEVPSTIMAAKEVRNIPLKAYKGLDPNQVYGVDVQTVHPYFPLYVIFPEIDAHQPWLFALRLTATKKDRQKYLNWMAQRRGYSSLTSTSGNYFIGLDNLGVLTRHKNMTLLVLLPNKAGGSCYEIYDKFRIGSKAQGYKINELGASFGTCSTDWLRSYMRKKYKIFGVDRAGRNPWCPLVNRGAWWGSRPRKCEFPSAFVDTMELYISPIDENFNLNVRKVK